MFYQLNQNKLQEIPYYEIATEELTVALITTEELAEIYEEIGFDSETYQQSISKTSTFQNSPLIYSSYSFGIMTILEINDTFQTKAKFAFYLMKNLLLVIDLSGQCESTRQAFDSMLSRAKSFPMISLAQLFSCFLTCFLFKDNQSLELLEIELEKLEKKVMGPNMEHIRQELFYYRRKLLLLRNYYEQYITIAEDLAENVNQIFDPNHLVHFHQLESRVKRLCDHARDLSEYVSQIKESYMAQLDINLNSTMKLFTIVATVFMPLTLIVGWYGMNFKFMPELSWKYGYVWVILLSLAVLLICILWFKKKKFFERF